MKKLFGLFAALAFSASLMAANTANFVIYVESPDNVDIYDELVLAENADYSAAYENLRDAEKMADANNPSLYGYVETRKCGVIATNDLEGTLLTLETVNEENYDISFYNVAGTTYYLIDLVSGEKVQIAEGITLELRNVAANSTLTNRFLISKNNVAPVASLTTNAYGWASFSYDANLVATVPAGLNIYKGALAGDVLNLDEMDYVAADEGVIVFGAPNTKYYFAAGSGSSSFAGNALKPSSLWSYDPNDVIYCLRGDALYHYTGADMPANKAYLNLGSGAPAPKRISFHFEETQAIENVEFAAPAEKFIENGEVLIRRGEAVYNLQGQMVR